jgi:hypothetical protein
VACTKNSCLDKGWQWETSKTDLSENHLKVQGPMLYNKFSKEFRARFDLGIGSGVSVIKWGYDD